jgi:hypothetical protein
VDVTALGRTLCGVIDARVHAEDEDQALMLDSEDPFAYAQFAQRLGQMEDVLLVDPYFRPPQLIELASGGSVRRILIGMNLRDAELLPLSLALRGLPRRRSGGQARSTTASSSRHRATSGTLALL